MHACGDEQMRTERAAQTETNASVRWSMKRTAEFEFVSTKHLNDRLQVLPGGGPLRPV